MKNARIQITNETFEELANLKEFIRRLSISSQAKLACATFLESSSTRLQQQPLELDMVKLQLIVKLQQEILQQIATTFSNAQTIIEAEIALLGMFQELQHKLSLNEQVLNLKVVITLMDFKIHLRYGLEPKLSMEELLPFFDQLHLWERYIESRHTHVKYFYLCLIQEYLVIEDIANALQVLLELIDYLLKHISGDKVAHSNKDIQNKEELRLMLLKLHLIYKSLKKVCSTNIQLKNQHKIYSALYQLDHSIIQQYTFNFKKQQSKGNTEILLFLRSNLVQMILDYNEQTIQRECLMGQPKKISVGFKKSLSVQAVNRRQSVCAKLKEKAFSLKKIQSNPIKIQNKMFIPTALNPNVMLERRINFKQEIGGPSNKKVLRLNKPVTFKQIQQEEHRQTVQSSEKQPNPSKNNQSRNNTLSYESCKKNSLNKNYQLDMMICPRPNRLSLKLCTPNNPARDSSLFKTQACRKRRVIAKKGSIHFSHNRSNSQRQDVIQQETCLIALPPSIHRVLQRYLHGFRQVIFYETQRQSFPVYKYISLLHLNVPYFFEGRMLTLKKLVINTLTFTVTYCQKQNTCRVVKIDLIEEDMQRMKTLLRQTQRTKYQLLSFYCLGKVIELYTLNISLPSIHKAEKLEVKQIKDQRQIYTHAAILTCQDYHKYHIKKILLVQAQYIDSINRSLEIPYHYGSLRRNHKTATQVIQTRPSRFWHFLRPDSALKPTLVETGSIKVSLKIGKHIVLTTVRLVRNSEDTKLFAVLEYAPNKYFKKYAVLALKQMPLDKVVKVVDCLNSRAVSTSIIQKQWSDVQLIQPMFRLTSKKYVTSLPQRGYRIYQSFNVVEKELMMVTGQTDKIKWFILVMLRDFQPSIVSCLRRESKRDGKKVATKKQITSGHTSRSFPPLKQDMYQLWRKEQIRSIQINESVALLDRRQYKLFYFQFSWTIFQGNMFYHCFYHHNQVLAFKLAHNKLLYISKYAVSPDKRQKSLVYSHFRRQLAAQLMSRKMLIVEWNMMVLVKVEVNSITCKIHDSQDQLEIVVKPQELMGFRTDTSMIDASFLRRKEFLNRLKKVFKSRYQDREHRLI